MKTLLDHPVVEYLVISVCSLVVALVCFKLGGSLAKISGNEGTFLGVTFEASGLIGGFFIIFLTSQKALEKFRTAAATRRDTWAISVKVHVHADPKLDPPASKYLCDATLSNEVTGQRRPLKVEPGWEAGALTMTFPDVSLTDFVGAMITDDQDRKWYLEDFKPLTHFRQATPLS
jgi:hypothetical protein